MTLDAGRALRSIREEHGLSLKDVETASTAIAENRGIEEFVINPSRLSDIETKGVIPSIYRLCAFSIIYKVTLDDLLKLYGIDLKDAEKDFTLTELPFAPQSMVRPLGKKTGQILRLLREQTGLTLREVEFAARALAEQRGIEEFNINPNRLSDIETKGVIPSIYRIYALSVIYQVDFYDILHVYVPDLVIRDLSELQHPLRTSMSGLGSSDFRIAFDPKLSPQQIRATLQALADYYRACGGIGFQIDFELEDILVMEPAYV